MKQDEYLSNFSPIEYDFESFKARRFPYSSERLTELRKEHNDTHSFFRHRDSILGIWAEGKDLSEGTPIQIGLGENDVIESATRHILFKTFLKNLPGRKALSFYPLQTISTNKKHDTARRLLPDNLKDIIKFQRVTEIYLRTISKGEESISGLVVGLRQRWLIKKSLKDLIDDGFNPIGRPVIHLRPLLGAENVLEPDGISLGRLIRIRDEIGIVNTSSGDEEYNLDELSLRKSRSEIFDSLAFYTSEKTAREIFDAIHEQDSINSDPQEYHSEVSDVLNYLAQWNFRTLSGFKFKVSTDHSLKLPSIPLNPTNYIFDITPGAASDSVTTGLIEHGPYDSSRFVPKIPNFLVVCSKYNRGGFSKFMGALQKGLPSSKYFKQGLIKLYRLQKIEWDVCELGDFSSESVYKAILSKIEKQKPDLVLVEGQEPKENEKLSDNPYWRAKSLCLSNGIPFQSVLPWRTRQSPDKYQWILGPLALQIYAKLGGTPWVIESSADVDHEIVIGVGSYTERETEFKGGLQKRFVGVSTFFSREGTFMLASKCKAVPYEEYLDALLENLKDSSWRESQTIRLVFHIFKPVRRDEVLVIDRLIKEFPEYDIKYAFVTVSTNQPLQLFDDSSSSRILLPEKSSNLLLSQNESIIQLKGRNEVKNPKQGIPRPAVIRIHERSTFQDIHHVTQQIFDFTSISWRGFFPLHLPVTIFYSNLIAENLQKLSNVPGWNPAAIGVQLKRKKWFL